MAYTNEAINDIEYHFAQAAITALEQGQAIPQQDGKSKLNGTTALNGGLTIEKRRLDPIAYNMRGVDNGTNQDEGKGYFRVFGTASSLPNPKTGKMQNALAIDGEEVSYAHAKALGEGKDPTTGDQAVKLKKGKDGKVKRRVGYDQQFSMPKSASILWGLGRAAEKRGSNTGARYARGVERAIEKATQRILQYAYDNKLLITRRSGERMGYEAVRQAVMAAFHHKTSRKGDMQVHCHNVWFNICLREDGTTGGVDNARLKQHGRAMAALFHGEAAFVLKQELPELSISRSGSSWEVDGVAEVLIDTFSKRRKQILDAAEDFGIKDVARHREASININRNTRDSKDKIPPLSDLMPRWELEAKAKGYTFEAIVEAVQEAAEKKQRDSEQEWAERRAEAAAEGIELPEERPALSTQEMTEEAFRSLTGQHSVFEEKLILAEVAEAMMTHANVNQFEQVISQVKESGRMVEIGQREDTTYFSTDDTMAKERRLLRNAKLLQNNRAPIDPALVEAMIARGKVLANGKIGYLRPEQEAAVRHLCGGSQFGVVKGRAGTGKSFMSGFVADIHRELGMTVHGLGPSHTAKDVLADDAAIAAELARAVTGFINDYDKGNLKLGPDSVILVDEFGMLGLDQADRLLQIAVETKSAIYCVGDDDQLQPIANGAAMKMVVRPEIAGCKVLGEIVRQSGWQREASMKMSEGHVKDGMSKYMDMGKVGFEMDREKAKEDVVKLFIDDLVKNPHETRVMQAILNRTVSELNMMARVKLHELGIITGEETVIKSWTRGRNGRVTETGFCRNDLVILGESFKHNGELFPNNLSGRVLDIYEGSGKEPIFEIQWRDGRITKLMPSEMVGYRPENAKDKTSPKLQHGYARTVYSQQGSTYNRTFTLVDSTPSRELMYVLMTRHKNDAEVIVDAGRYSDDIASRQGTKLVMDKHTGATDENSMVASDDINMDQIKEQFLKECQRSGAKLNACDFHEDIETFMYADVEREVSKSVAYGTVRQEEQAVSNFRKSYVRGMGQVGAKAAEPAERVRGRIEDRKEEIAAAKEAPKPATRQKPKQQQSYKDQPKGRVSGEEINVMVHKDLRDYMLRNGASYAKDVYKAHEGRKLNGGPFTGGTEYTLSFGKGQGCVVTETASGNWLFFMRDGSAKGDIRNFVMWRDGCDFGEANQKLREEFRTYTAEPNSLPSYSPQEKKPEETLRQKFDRLLDGTYIAEKYQELKGWYEQAEAKISGYLLSRGFTRESQTDFADEFKVEGHGRSPQDAQNRGGVMFPMTDIDGNVHGIGRKGPPSPITNGKSFGFAAKGSERHLIRMGETENPQRIYTGEAVLDAWALYQRDGRLPGSMIAATAGSMGDIEQAELYQLAQKHPKAQWIYAAQNDKTNDKGVNPAERIQNLAVTAIKEGNAQVDIDIRQPPAEVKDWTELQEKEMPKEQKQPGARQSSERQVPDFGRRPKATTGQITDQAERDAIRAEQADAAAAQRQQEEEERRQKEQDLGM